MLLTNLFYLDSETLFFYISSYNTELFILLSNFFTRPNEYFGHKDPIRRI